MKKLAGWAGLVAATWAGYHMFSKWATPNTDAALLGVIAVVSFECVAVQIAWTWKWRALSLGLLSFFLATGFLYLRVSADTYGHDLWQTRAMLELIRALYLDAAVLTAIGLTRWAVRNRDAAFPWWRKRGEQRDPFLPPE